MKRRIAEYSPPNRFTFHLSRTTRTAFLSILRDAEEGFRICSRWEGGEYSFSSIHVHPDAQTPRARRLCQTRQTGRSRRVTVLLWYSVSIAR